MRVMAECMVCHEEARSEGKVPEAGEYSADLVENVIAEVDDGFLAYFECSKGHRSIGYLNKHRFEVLLESGLLAYTSGFHSEAVLSFSASLERLFELFIRTALHKRQISFADIDNMWKQLKKQSERQLGAFHLLHLIEIGKPYTVSPNIVEFRNKVVHQGYVPTATEVADWAEQVVNVIFDVVTELRSRYRASLTQIVFSRAPEVGRAVAKAKANNPVLEGVPIVTIMTPSFVGLDLADALFQRQTFAELIERTNRLKGRLGY